MRTYKKNPLTYQEQVELLKSRGLVVPDESRAKRLLANISYYRLSAYMLPFKEKVNGKVVDSFKPGTSWDAVYDLYVFDRKLRLLVFDAIERIEIAIRTQIIYQLSHKYGANWQDDPSIFKGPVTRVLRNGNSVTDDVYSDIQNYIREQLQSNRAEVFIQHYRTNYNNPINPPSWMTVEILYFNHLSRICNGLKYRADINGIANYFCLSPQIFCSWLHTINYIRNLCAHHARLWNRDMNIVPEKLHFSKSLKWISNPDTVQRGKIYYFLCMIIYLLQTVNPTSSFKNRIMDLLDEYKDIVSLSAMGFSSGWEAEDLWK